MSSIPPQPHISTAYVDVLEKFDKEIVDLEAKLLALKQTRNEHAAISRLHPEILQEIFLFIHSSPKSYRKWKKTLAVTWICHRWRQIAHHTTPLWSYIDSPNLEWINAALHRSKNRGLEFSFYGLQLPVDPDAAPSRGSQLIRLALQHVSRTRGLCLEAIQVLEFEPMSGAPEWMNAAPILETLDLKNLSLPRNAFSGIYPSLQSLRLSSCRVDWDTLPLVSGLKQLSLIDTEPFCALEKIIQILHVPQQDLQELTLVRCIDTPPIPGDTPCQRIILPNLEEFHVDEEDQQTITHLLRHISLPPCTRVELWPCDGHRYEIKVMSELIAARQLEQWPISHLCFGLNLDDMSLRLHIVEDWDNESDIDDELDHDTGSVQLNFCFDEDRPLAEAVSIIKSLPIHPIRNVVVREFEGEDTEILTYLAELGTIQELSIRKDAMNILLRIIKERTAKLTADVLKNADLDQGSKNVAAQNALSFQNLEKLTITGYSYSQDRFFKRKEMQPLRAWLRLRKVYGCPLNLLVLRKITVSSISWVEELFEGVVQELRIENVKEREPREQDV